MSSTILYRKLHIDEQYYSLKKATHWWAVLFPIESYTLMSSTIPYRKLHIDEQYYSL